MAQEYLPAPSNIRLADLMKEHNISQPELAKEIGCSKSTISRFISGAKGTLTHEQVLKIARLFNVSTDFLLGETNIPDRKNYDIYGFTDGEEHPLIGTAIYFYLTKGRAKKTEEQAMDNLWLELPWWFD